MVDLRDADLLRLCLELNLISEDGYFLLDQCRDVRNNFSAAHPSVGALDEDEFINFLNRVGRHALSNEHNPRGVDIHAFIGAVKAARFNAGQRETWRTRIEGTFDAQRRDERRPDVRFCGLGVAVEEWARADWRSINGMIRRYRRSCRVKLCLALMERAGSSGSLTACR